MDTLRLMPIVGCIQWYQIQRLAGQCVHGQSWHFGVFLKDKVK